MISRKTNLMMMKKHELSLSWKTLQNGESKTSKQPEEIRVWGCVSDFQDDDVGNSISC